jgi:hypothetical protein
MPDIAFERRPLRRLLAGAVVTGMAACGGSSPVTTPPITHPSPSASPAGLCKLSGD